MAEPQPVDNGDLTDYNVLVDDVTDATLGTGAKQLVGLTDATIGATTKVAAGGGVEANALRVTLASDSTGLVSVDDNGGSLTVDGSVGVSGTVTVDSELTTADLDTGAGTDTRAVVGLVKAASGGGVLVSDANPLPISDAGSTVSVDDGAGSLTVDGTVTANLAAGTNNIGDVDVLTVPAPLSTTGGGTEATALRVTLANDSTGLVSVDDNGGSLTVDGTVTTTPSGDHTVVGKAADGAAVSGNPVLMAGQDGTNVQSLKTDASGELQVDVLTLPNVTNAGTFAVQVDGAALTALQLIDDIVKTDDAAFAVGTDEVAVAGFLADETSTDSVDEGDAGAARMTLDRKVIVTNQPHSAGGCDIFRSLDLDETEEEVKGTAGTLYGYYIANLATSTRFVKFYNATAANVTVGTTTPVLTLPIPGNSTDDVGANMLGGVGVKFDTAITVAATTGVADADTGAPGANEVVINLYYK